MDMRDLGRLIESLPSVTPNEQSKLLDSLVDRLRAERANPGPSAALLFSAAFETLRSLAEKLPTISMVRCLGLIASHYQDSAQPEASLAPAKLAVDVARSVADPEWLAKANKALGSACYFLGDLAGAVSAYAEALDIARGAGDRVEEAANWCNLGAVYVDKSHYSEAVAMLEKAVALAGDRPDLRAQKRIALSNLAVAALRCRDIAKGLRASQHAIEMMHEPVTANECLLRVNAESTLVQLLLEANLLDHAKEHAALMRIYADRSHLELARINSAMAEGLVEIACGKSDVGFSRLQGCLEISRKSIASSMPESLLTIIKGFEIDGRPDAALVYLNEYVRLKENAAELAITSHLSAFGHQDRSIDRAAKRRMFERQQDLRGSMLLQEPESRNTELLEEQSVAAELHDDTTGLHCYRVGRLAAILARGIGIEDGVCELIDLAARLHDIGKLTVPDAILLKPGKLTPEERAIMERHTTSGAAILSRMKVPQIYIAKEIALHHHERWDGTGYPQKLKGAAIPLAARVTALADVFDALTHVRPYKQAWTIEASLEEIARLRGAHFDPDIAGHFLALVPRLIREHGDLDAYLGAAGKNNELVARRAAVARALKGEDGAGMCVEDPRR